MSILTSLLRLCLVLCLVGASAAFASERRYFKNVEGTWSGSGKIVAGKYKNTRFTCDFGGPPPKGVGMEIGGKCRVGLFSQPMSATITKRGGTFKGKFLDGAKGKGLDILSGRLRSNRLVVNINRKQLNGVMVANLKNSNKMQITISVRANKKLIPVIGLTLNRTSHVAKTSFAD